MISVQPFPMSPAEMPGQALVIPEEGAEGLNFADLLQPPAKAVANIAKIKPTIKVDPKVEEILAGLIEAQVPFQALQITESGEALVVSENLPKAPVAQNIKVEGEPLAQVSQETIGQESAKVVISKEPAKLANVTPLPLDHETVKAIQSEFTDEHTIKPESQGNLVANAATLPRVSRTEPKVVTAEANNLKQVSPQSAPAQVRVSADPHSGQPDAGADLSGQNSKTQTAVKPVQQQQQQPVEFTQAIQRPVEKKVNITEPQVAEVATTTQKDLHVLRNIQTEQTGVKDTMPQVISQIAPKIQEAARDGVEKITVQLSPKSLGAVEVQLAITKDGRIDAVITAHNADTADLLSRNAKTLELALQDSGFESNLSFTHNNQGGTFSQANAESNLKNSVAANDKIDDELSAEARTKTVHHDANRAIDIHA